MSGAESWADASSAGDGRHALLFPRLLHFDLTDATVSVYAVADRFPPAMSVRALQAAVGGSLAPLAGGLLLSAHPRYNGVLLQISLYCRWSVVGVLDAVLTQQTTDRTMTAWRQLRDQAPALLREHLMPALPPPAPWVVSELRPDAPSRHASQWPWLQDVVRSLAHAWLLP